MSSNYKRIVDTLNTQARSGKQPYIFATLLKDTPIWRATEIVNCCKILCNENYHYYISGEVVIGRRKEGN